MRTILSVFITAAILAGGGTARALCIDASTANLRLGPGTNYKAGWTVYKYFPLRKIGVSVSRDWYAVKDIDGDLFWVHKSLVTTSYKCGVVTAAKANVRRGPGTRYGKLFPEPVGRYYSFRVLGRKGMWIKIRDEDNFTGWIRRDYCRTE
jgi:SH3-like domain-containing protein